MLAGTANSSSVAEHALFLMLTLAKRGGELDVLVRAGRWAERMTAVPVDLLGKTVLVVGFGRTGTRVAKRCLAMEMTVIVYDPYLPAENIRAAECEPVSDLDAALPRADRDHSLPTLRGNDRNVRRGAVAAHEKDRLSRQHRARRNCR